jgi:hypothetical protein
MGTGKGIGTLDGSWMRDHMYRLSQLVLFLKQNVKVRFFCATERIQNVKVRCFLLQKNEKRENEVVFATKRINVKVRLFLILDN